MKDELLISVKMPIISALKKLNESHIKILFTVDESGRLLGSLTDGDIRRALLKGIAVTESLELAHNSSVQSARISEVGTLKEGELLAVPIIDELGVVQSVFCREDRQKIKDVPLVIMAGGLGTRLRPYTETVPKPLLPINGKPILEHILSNAAREGFRRVFISVGYLGSMICDYFGTGERLGLTIEYIKESERLGTCGALAFLRDRLGSNFILMNGDVVTDLSLRSFYNYLCTSGVTAVMAVKEEVTQIHFGVVECEGVEVRSLTEKPTYRNYVNTGIYGFSPNVLEYVEDGLRMDATELINKLLQTDEHRVLVYPIAELWVDVGRIDQYEKLR
jgi:dTDP-glucose pyrophosphorylase